MTSKAKKIFTQNLFPKKGRVDKLKKDAATQEVLDIEDAANHFAIKSQYFSPLQTREQRKRNHLSEQLVVEASTSRSLQEEIEVKTTKSIEDHSVKKYEQKLLKNIQFMRSSSVEAFNSAPIILKSPYFSPLQTREQRKRKTLSVKDSKHAVVEIRTAESEQQNIGAETIGSIVNHSTNKSKQVVVTNSSVNLKESAQSEWEPAQWQEMLENIRKMRSSSVAPVDRMGCHKCADEFADEKTQRFHILVALMLSSQTKDEITFIAMQRLKSHTLTPDAIVKMDTTELENILHPVSFYKTKAKHLQQTARTLIEKYKSDIPNNIKELVALPGVGPKMAHICMSVAWNEVTGIGVDVHVHRIANRLRWTQRETKKPEDTRVALEKWLPRALWSDVNHLLVGFGQVTCTPLRPHCSECLNRNICPSADKV